ncbi:hypothetical protein F4679DRAFT_547695 [Xylaria curta]|nr:hypothetical protein F4679DRAFT_547695 [Xylaria curta]
MPKAAQADATPDPVYPRLILIKEDGIERGGIEVPETRDTDRSVTIIIKPGARYTTGLHWHERKNEYLQVLQGHALVTVGGDTEVFGPDDGIITVSRFTPHEFGRADQHEQGADSKNIELRIKEWTDPPDGEKEVFFRNILGVINSREPGVVGTMKLLLSIVAVFREHDNYPVIIKGPAVVRRWTTYLVIGFISVVSRLFGFRGTDAKYTPPDILQELQHR